MMASVKWSHPVPVIEDFYCFSILWNFETKIKIKIFLFDKTSPFCSLAKDSRSRCYETLRGAIRFFWAVFCSTTLTSTGWVRSTVLSFLHRPLTKQCAVDKSRQHQKEEKNSLKISLKRWDLIPGRLGAVRERYLSAMAAHPCHFLLCVWTF